MLLLPLHHRTTLAFRKHVGKRAPRTDDVKNDTWDISDLAERERRVEGAENICRYQVENRPPAVETKSEDARVTSNADDEPGSSQRPTSG